jgi:nitrile hydratase subunit alpha
MTHDDDHDHHQDPPSEPALRVKALETILTERGYIDPARIDEVVERFQNSVGPRNGAKVIAKAWCDEAYRARLMANATDAIAELGFSGPQGEHMIAVANAPNVHNLIVCTLCSCYPRPVLGLPPDWYKAKPYRARAVVEPRKVLAEFGTIIPDDVEVRVHDSTAMVRYMVLPRRPEGTGNYTEEQLAALVTRDTMIGVVPARVPEGSAVQ